MAKTHGNVDENIRFLFLIMAPLIVTPGIIIRTNTVFTPGFPQQYDFPKQLEVCPFEGEFNVKRTISSFID